MTWRKNNGRSKQPPLSAGEALSGRLCFRGVSLQYVAFLSIRAAKVNPGVSAALTEGCTADACLCNCFDWSPEVSRAKHQTEMCVFTCLLNAGKRREKLHLIVNWPCFYFEISHNTSWKYSRIWRRWSIVKLYSKIIKRVACSLSPPLWDSDLLGWYRVHYCCIAIRNPACYDTTLRVWGYKALFYISRSKDVCALTPM